MNYAVATLMLMLLSGLAQAQESCAAKEAEISRQLEHGRAHGNDRRGRGLETALKNVRVNCTDEGLQAERQEEIEEARDEVVEREADLREALEEGSARKIETRKHKVLEAQGELHDVLAE